MEVGEKKSRLTWVRGVSRHVETGLRRARTARRAPRSVLTRDRHNGIALTIACDLSQALQTLDGPKIYFF